jgi:hypothetical protein
VATSENDRLHVYSLCSRPCVFLLSFAQPVIKVEKQWIHSGENNQAELTCIIHAQPAPAVTWLKDGVELDPESPHWKARKEEGDGNVYTLELKNLKREHFGVYACRAGNSMGSAEDIIELSGVANKVRDTKYLLQSIS